MISTSIGLVHHTEPHLSMDYCLKQIPDSALEWLLLHQKMAENFETYQNIYQQAYTYSTEAEISFVSSSITALFSVSL